MAMFDWPTKKSAAQQTTDNLEDRLFIWRLRGRLLVDGSERQVRWQFDKPSMLVEQLRLYKPPSHLALGQRYAVSFIRKGTDETV